MSEPKDTGTNHAEGGENHTCHSCTQMFQLSMGMFSRALTGGDYQVGLHWLKQAGNLTAQDAESKLLQRDGFARLILAAASSGVKMALHSGNITKQQKELAEVIDRASQALLDVSQTDTALLPVATVLSGFAGQHVNRLDRYFAVEQLVTPTDRLDNTLGSLFTIIEHASKLDRHPEEALPSRCDRLALATTAVSNADCYLSWFWSSRFSDWERGEVTCRRMAEWLTHCETVPCKIDPDFDDCDTCDVVTALNTAAAAFKLRSYKQSKKAIKVAEEALADVSCV